MVQASELTSLADAPGTSREYETIYILRPNTTNEGVAEVNERVRRIVDSMGGKIIKVDNWGKRRLAYEIEKERKGIYLYWQYLGTRGVVEEIERNMRMLDAVIRYMTVKLDADVNADVRPTEVDDETFERAANTAADEEDLYLTRTEGEDEDEDEDDDEFSGVPEAIDMDDSGTDDGAAAADGADVQDDRQAPAATEEDDSADSRGSDDEPPKAERIETED